jgi:hypothetical protein
VCEHDPIQEAARVRRFRIFLLAEGVLLILTVLACGGLIHFHAHAGWGAVFIALAALWHVVAIPICFAYLIGKPIVMTLVPLLPSAQSKAFLRELKERPVLDDQSFFGRYYAGTGISDDVVAGVRRALSWWDPLFERTIPADHLYLLNEEVHFSTFIQCVEREMGIRFTSSDQDAMDGTLDNLILLTQYRFNFGQNDPGELA